MKQIIPIIVSLLLPCVAYAQPKAQIKVQYSSTAPSRSPKPGKPVEMTLLTGKDGSMYFNPMSLYVDSLCSTADGKAKLREIQMKAWVTTNPDGSMSIDMTKGNAPKKSVYTYAIKDPAKSTVTLYGKWGSDNGYYTEPYEQQQWEVVADSTATVLGYECVMARMAYHGREWKAWFAPEIPVQDGPWKFCGLPGLILKAETADGLFSFVADALQTVDEPMPPMYSERDYSKTDRREALKSEDYLRNNEESVLKAQLGPTVRIDYRDENGNPIEVPKFDRQLHAIETDY